MLLFQDQARSAATQPPRAPLPTDRPARPQFEVKDANKKFDKGAPAAQASALAAQPSAASHAAPCACRAVTRLQCRLTEEGYDMVLDLDVNTDLYPLEIGDKFSLALAPTLSLDGAPDAGARPAPVTGHQSAQLRASWRVPRWAARPAARADSSTPTCVHVRRRRVRPEPHGDAARFVRVRHVRQDL